MGTQRKLGGGGLKATRIQTGTLLQMSYRTLSDSSILIAEKVTLYKHDASLQLSFAITMSYRQIPVNREIVNGTNVILLTNQSPQSIRVMQ